MKYIDVRSDTVTWPTDAMRNAMAGAEVGDDVYGDDPTVNRLELLAAEMTGKEAALYVPSGTFGNQLALFTHCTRGSEVILGDDCHIVAHEAGAAAVIAGVQLRTVETRAGRMDIEEVRRKVRRGDDIHYPPTTLICLENAYGNGAALPLSYMDEIRAIAGADGLKVHLDGARLFNAAAALKVDAKEIASRCDSAMFCLSKGLCAPVGSMLVGSSDFVSRARRKRKLMGGGLRQSGILAAAGIIALRDMVPRLGEDHENARALAASLSKIPGVTVDAKGSDINMVFFSVNPAPDPEIVMERLLKKGILANPPEDGMFRFVTHYWIKKENLGAIVAAFSESIA